MQKEKKILEDKLLKAKNKIRKLKVEMRNLPYLQPKLQK